MNCKKCGSEWKSKIISKICPFCGESLEEQCDNELSFQSMSEVLRYIVDNYGIKTYQNSSLLLSYVSDLAPLFISERRLLKMCAESGIIEKMAEQISAESDNKDSLEKKYISTLHEQYYLDRNAAKLAIGWLMFGLGHDISNNLHNYSEEKDEIIKEETHTDNKNQITKKKQSTVSKSKADDYSSKTNQKNTYNLGLVNYVGKRLDGRYEVQEIIGVGGMSVVYKAYDNVDDRIVAIKVLKEEFLNNEEFKRRFKNESKVIALLSHPNIVRVYDVHFGEKLQYIVMEYIDGITLKEYINKQGAITWNDALFFMTQILKAVQYAHDKGIVHRNIKPQNIILLPTGNIKVTDFGIARFSRSETRTLTEQAIGSVHYISPEQAKGEFTDEKADVYSLGVVLYEMLAGSVPFEADSAISVALMQLQADAKKLTDINSDIPLGLEQICIHAMQKNTLDRYQTATEMLFDIGKIIENPNMCLTKNNDVGTYIDKRNTLHNYLLRTNNGYLSWSETKKIFIPFIRYLLYIDINNYEYIQISPDNLYFENDKLYISNLTTMKSKIQSNKYYAIDGYSAIEIYKTGKRDETSLVYSVGMCLYRSLVGINPPSALKREVNDKLMIPNEIVEKLPMKVIKALGAALQIYPEKRMNTLKELLLLLDSVPIDAQYETSDNINDNLKNNKKRFSFRKLFFK